VSTGRTFPTGVGAPILLEGLQVIGRVRPSSVIHRSQALLAAWMMIRLREQHYSGLAKSLPPAA
jgi:hypothetical protein